MKDSTGGLYPSLNFSILLMWSRNDATEGATDCAWCVFSQFFFTVVCERSFAPNLTKAVPERSAALAEVGCPRAAALRTEETSVATLLSVISKIFKAHDWTSLWVVTVLWPNSSPTLWSTTTPTRPTDSRASKPASSTKRDSGTPELATRPHMKNASLTAVAAASLFGSKSGSSWPNCAAGTAHSRACHF